MIGSPYGPYNPYFDPSLYMMAQDEKRQLKRTSNALCWLLIASTVFLYAISIAGRVYLNVVGYTAVYTNPDFHGFTPVLYYLLNGVTYSAGLAIPAFLYLSIFRIPPAEVLPFQKNGFLKTGACVLFGVAVCMLANIPASIVSNIENMFGFDTDLSMPLTDDPAVLILFFITIAVAPPIVEELIFRGIVLQRLRKFGDGFAIVGSALLFGLFHGNLVQIVFAFIAGLVMALVDVRTNSLLPSILIHFCNNAISFVLTVVQRLYGDTAGSYLNNAVFGAAVLLGVGSLVYLWAKDRNFFQGGAGNPVFRTSEKIKTLFLNFGGIVLLIYAFLSSVYTLTQ
ncbi:MAG: CAAX amino terminal protease self-immunity [Eubacteriales bacterium]|jgi:uncharacterized protein